MTTTANTASPWYMPPEITVRPRMIRGTCYFLSHSAAITYYETAHNVPRAEALQMVRERLDEGQIKIGKPWVNGVEVPESKLVLVDGRTRWGIIE